MSLIKSIQPTAGKLLRIALTFALVFALAFNGQYVVAYAASSLTLDDGSGHEGETLTDLVLYEEAETDGETKWYPIANGSALGSEAATVYLSDVSGDREIVAVPIWDNTYPEGYAESEPVNEVASCTFAKWDIEDSEGVVEQSVAPTSNVLTLKALKTGDVTVRCLVNEGAADQLAVSFTVKSTLSGIDDPNKEPGGDGGDDPDNPGKDPSEEETILKLSSVEMLTQAGDAFTSEPELTFSDSQLPARYRLKARVVAQYGEDMLTYTVSQGDSLASISDDRLEDLEWTVSNTDIASISEEGVLEVTGAGEFTVSCVAHVKASTEEMFDTITVRSGEKTPDDSKPTDIQGESHPQGSLRIVANLPKKSDAGTSEPNQPDQPGDATNPNGEGADGSGDASENASVTEGTGAGSGTDEHEGAGGNEGTGSADTPTTPSASGTTGRSAVEKTYSLEELTQMSEAGTLPFDTRTFNMASSSGGLSIKGHGFSLMNLLRLTFAEQDIELDTLPIESVSFVDYRGLRTTLNWSLVQAVLPMMAVQSLVETPGDVTGGDTGGDTTGGATEGNTTTGGDETGGATAGEGTGETGDTTTPEAPGEGDATTPGTGEDENAPGTDEPQLLDNTRFRVLFDSSAANVDAEALRWINSIELNMESTDSDDLVVGVSYVPVPLGVEAEFVAAPNHTINGQWDCRWESSRDGVVWVPILGARNQTLRVMTSTETVGTYYRVTIDNQTSLGAGDDSKHLKGTSEPVLLQVGSGFSVVLSYNPPRAGDIAVFRSSIYGYDGNPSNLKYFWEWSTDGGISWSQVKNESKPTLKIPTEPISDEGGSGSGDGGGTPNLVYIRVRVISPADEVRVSNAQPLTVHVGEDDTDVGGEDENGRTDGAGIIQGGDDATPTKPSAPVPNTGGTTPKQVIEPVEITINMPSATPTAALDPEGTQEMPTESEASGAEPQVLIDESVTEQILQQEQEAQETMQSSVPGARWTALSTLNPTSEEVRRVLENNPIVPFVAPTALGFLVAGMLEKLIAYRRQLA